MTITGNLVGDHDNAVDAVYTALLAQKQIILWTANNTDMIRDALKEAERNRRSNGIQTKLYLRAQSMEQIEGMTKPQIQALLTDIIENIVYGDDFPKTQQKWAVEQIPVKSPYNYNQRKENWKRKVGDL